MVKGGMSEMTLKDEWDRLDSDTRQWLVANPGCVLVPRSVNAGVKQESVRRIEVDVHGQMMLSREDLDFIRERNGRGRGPSTCGIPVLRCNPAPNARLKHGTCGTTCSA
jgi:hypothetical protein